MSVSTHPSPSEQPTGPARAVREAKAYQAAAPARFDSAVLQIDLLKIPGGGRGSR